MTDPATTTTSTLPLAQGVWTLDPNHSGVHFKVRHIGLSNVRGRFNRYEATLTVGGSLDDTQVTADIDLASVDTNQPDRDAHLLGTDFFSAEQHPTMAFRSTAVYEKGDGEYELVGELTLNGITKPIPLNVEFHGTQVFPGDGKEHAGFSATTVIARDDFGVDFNMPLGLDTFALGKKISVELELQFVAPSGD
jgi:polyisoprenoid-binding protein YceI